jgi:hypothetical protein
MESGRVGEYEWVESHSFDLGKLLKNYPEAVVGKYVVISSFDSGPLEPSPEEVAKGWHKRGELLMTTRVSGASELPFEQYDEWYVFPQATVPKIAEVFVNYGDFTLTPPDQFVQRAATTGAQADLVGAKHLASQLAERQLLFWEQLRECKPESFIADGNVFMFVCRNSELFRNVRNAISSTE